MNLHESAAARLGLTRSQRSEHLRRASERGDVRRLTALLEAGVDLGDADEYGHTPLFVAAWRGHASVVELLLHWGAEPNKPSNGGVLPVAAATVCGHDAVLRILKEVDNPIRPAPLVQHYECCQAREALAATFTPIPTGRPHGRNSRTCYIDNAFPEDFLCSLESLWRSLPAARKGTEEAHVGEISAKARKQSFNFGARRADRSQQDAAPRRSYYCDVEGWVAREIASVLRCSYNLPQRAAWQDVEAEEEQRQEGDVVGRAPCEQAYVHMRFLHYAEPGGYLAPHTDLPRTDTITGKKSTHTFLLYLAGADPEQEGVSPGGETVLLERLDVASPALATVAPVRGRLFIFPHDCPHKAMPIIRPPKLLLRGEMH